MTIEKAAGLINGTIPNPELAGQEFTGVSIDSRSVAAGQLFTAIIGDSNDGHKFIDQAIKAGCGGLMINENYPLDRSKYKDVPAVAVKDTHLAMMQLAREYCSSVDTVKIGITGSNGKTTTKDFIYSIMHAINNNCFRSPGNLNNLYGLPLSIFQMPFDTEYGIFEMGISNRGEMSALCQIMTPDLAIITNVGATHLETLGSVQGVAEAKLELADCMDRSNPILINADNDILMKTAGLRHNRFISFGVENDADFSAEIIGLDNDGYPIIMIDGIKVRGKLFGMHQTYNLLVGYATAKVLGLDLTPEMLNEIDYSFAKYRGEIEHIDGITIIADCYNANPSSMESGLRSLKNYSAKKPSENNRITAVIGDMLELGQDSIMHHKNIGKLLADSDFDLIFAIGAESEYIVSSALANGINREKIIHFDSTDTAGEALLKDISRGDIIYFKASRGIGLEKIIKLVKRQKAGQV